VALNGQEVENLARLRLVVASAAVGSRMNVEIVRDGKHKRLDVTIGELPEDVTLSRKPQAVEGDFDNVFSGLTVGPLSRENALHFQLDPGGRGVVVLEVAAGSPASRAGVTEGDVIMEIDRQEVATLADYDRIARKIRKDKGALLLLARRGQTLFVGVEP